MRNTAFFIAALTLAAAASAAAAAPSGDVERSRALHEANCLACHDTSVYTRPNRQVRSLAALQQQINACGHNLPRRFSDEELRDLVKYLNDRFYRFE
jgi:cytochrome c5